MKYFKFKKKKQEINGAMCTLDFVNNSMRNNEEEGKELKVSVYYSEDPYTDFNVVSIDGETADIAELTKSQNPGIDLTEVKKAEFEKIKGESLTLKQDEAILAMHKNLYKEEIDKNRDDICESVIEYNGHRFAAGLKDQQLLTQTITLYQLVGELPENFGWISADNEIVPIANLQELVGLGAAIGARTNEFYIKARGAKDKVLAAESMEDIVKVIPELELK